jgi:hypothetical protein
MALTVLACLLLILPNVVAAEPYAGLFAGEVYHFRPDIDTQTRS